MAPSRSSLKSSSSPDSLKVKPKGRPPEPPCTSLSEDVHVPGLQLLLDFISADEEAALLAFFDREDLWDARSVARRVQHYGTSIDFRARGLSEDPVPPIPSLCMPPVLKRVVDAGICEAPPDQLTVNEYVAGQGISPHIDVHSLFGDMFLFLSLNSGIVMEFRLVGQSPPVKKQLWLPPRSLAVLTGEARYRWSHGIASRKSDKVDGELRPRGRRLSLSFRWIRIPAVCQCAFPEVCDSRAAAGAEGSTDSREDSL